MKRKLILLLLFLNCLVFSQQYQDFYIKGAQALEEQRYNDALKEFTASIKLNGEFAESYVKRGVSYQLLGDDANALRDFDMAVKIDNKQINAYYNRGLIYKNNADYPQAVNNFSRALELNDKMKYAYYNRGLCKLRLNDIKNACLDISKAADLGIDNAKEIYKYTCQK